MLNIGNVFRDGNDGRSSDWSAQRSSSQQATSLVGGESQLPVGAGIAGAVPGATDAEAIGRFQEALIRAQDQKNAANTVVKTLLTKDGLRTKAKPNDSLASPLADALNSLKSSSPSLFEGQLESASLLEAQGKGGEQSLPKPIIAKSGNSSKPEVDGLQKPATTTKRQEDPQELLKAVKFASAATAESAAMAAQVMGTVAGLKDVSVQSKPQNAESSRILGKTPTVVTMSDASLKDALTSDLGSIGHRSLGESVAQSNQRLENVQPFVAANRSQPMDFAQVQPWSSSEAMKYGLNPDLNSKPIDANFAASPRQSTVAPTVVPQPVVVPIPMAIPVLVEPSNLWQEPSIVGEWPMVGKGRENASVGPIVNQGSKGFFESSQDFIQGRTIPLDDAYQSPALYSTGDESLFNKMDLLLSQLQRSSLETGKAGQLSLGAKGAKADLEPMQSVNRTDITNSVWMASYVGRLANAGGGSIKVKIVPESLGELTISVRNHGGQLDVKLDASSRQARDVLMSQLSDLRQSLVAHQFDVRSIEVTHASAAGHAETNLGNHWNHENSQSGSHSGSSWSNSSWDRYFAQDQGDFGGAYQRHQGNKKYWEHRLYQ